MLLNIMKIWKNLFGKNDKISASEIAVNKDLLVSDAIVIEASGGKNYGWLKFANGVILEWFNEIADPAKFSQTTNTMQNLNLYIYQLNFTFRGSFKTVPTVITNGNINGGIGLTSFLTFSTNNTSTVLRAVSLFPVKENIRYSILAIGRWK